ncbi:hypothetical protein [Sphingobacterium faecium]|uniref:hypothetical protein n=1 Tax=Sphingobacterium faecium TaxID=34087 RepID=UPI002468489D|nr:hypothetical protein [Sphingobacterium faecium]MDH5826839.1 hypothetical protein [Sphingobacterium faecium]
MRTTVRVVELISLLQTTKPFLYAASEFPKINITISSKLRNIWMDIKNSSVENIVKNILNDCEKRDDGYKNFYHRTLAEIEGVTIDLEPVIRR